LDTHSEKRLRWHLVVELIFLLWAAILLLVGIRHLYLNPIIPVPKPTAVGSAISVTPSPLASPTPTLVPSSTVAQSASAPMTWTPTAHPPATLLPSTTPSPSPIPSATSTPSITPSARPLQSPTLEDLTLTPDTTPVTAVPSIVPTASVPDNAINIMLLGSDRRPNSTGWRTDVIIIVSINPDGPSAAMLSIPRDLFVWVPGWRMAKINTVDTHGETIGYAGGGPGLLKQTLLYNLGIPVHYYARVDFDGFKRIVDTLGGIEVPVTCAMTDWRLKSPELDLEVEENWELFTVDQRVHHMDGDFALWYSRSRLRSSDFDRSRRQQQVLRAMMAKAMDINIVPQIPQLWTDFADTVETDLGLGEILQLAAIAPQLDFNKIKSRFLAGDSIVAWTVPETEAYVLLPQFDAIAEIVADVFEPPALNRAFQDPPVVEVWNGTLRPDLDLLAVDNLLWEGLEPVLGTADRHDYTRTQVIFYGQTFKGADSWSITKLFGVYESQMIHQPNPDSPVDYRVILGYDSEPCVHKVWGARSAPTVTPTPVWTPPPG
jgi:LCP family protein required for cell wall assembly